MMVYEQIRENSFEALFWGVRSLGWRLNTLYGRWEQMRWDEMTLESDLYAQLFFPLMVLAIRFAVLPARHTQAVPLIILLKIESESICIGSKREASWFVFICIGSQRDATRFISICIGSKKEASQFVSICMRSKRDASRFVSICIAYLQALHFLADIAHCVSNHLVQNRAYDVYNGFFQLFHGCRLLKTHTNHGVVLEEITDNYR